MSVITALTSQNTTGVSGIHIIPADFVALQIQDVINDIPPKCIKTGVSNSSDANDWDVSECQHHFIRCRDSVQEFVPLRRRSCKSLNSLPIERSWYQHPGPLCCLSLLQMLI